MAKHRRASAPKSSGRAVAAPALIGGVAVAVAAAVTVPSPPVPGAATGDIALKAVITPGSATNWNADGIANFYGIDWSQTEYGPDVVIAPFRLVRFWQGPQNILEALEANAGESNIVVSSGRGAGNASWVISYLAATGDEQTLQDTVWILDNNVDRPNGGYAARYPFFALVGVNPVPTPTDTGAHIVDVGYEYAWNSSAPAYVANPIALANALVAYAYRYQQQDKLDLPDGALDPCGPEGCRHYVVAPDGTVVSDDVVPGSTTTFVTYEAAGVPLVQPLRDWGGDLGNLMADATEPILKVAIDASYPNNDPIGDPSVYTPMRVFAPPAVTIKALQQVPGALAEGLDSVRDDLGAAAATETLVAGDDAGADTPDAAGPVTRKPAVNPILKPLRRDSVKFSPDSVSRPASSARRGPLRTLVNSVFGKRPARDSGVEATGVTGGAVAGDDAATGPSGED